MAINLNTNGDCCVNIAKEVMRLLGTTKYKKFTTHKIIWDAVENVNAGDLTIYMAGCVAQIVSGHHSRGEEFRKKWNKSYGVNEKKAKGGVVNPATLEIG